MKDTPKYFFVLGLGLVVLSGLFMLLNHQGFVRKLLIYAFWSFFVGTLFYISGIKHEK